MLSVSDTSNVYPLREQFYSVTMYRTTTVQQPDVLVLSIYSKSPALSIREPLSNDRPRICNV